MMKRTRDDYDYDDVDVDNDDNDSFSSESGEFHRRKLRLKVKMPEERGEDDNDSPQPPPPQRKHFCVICSKQFSSGKAYGGHVRIHSSEYNNNKGKTKKMKMKKAKRKIGTLKKEKEKEIDLIRADVEGKIKCCLCGKEFQTMHSLFGHMRRHPDRSWKGIRPPPPPSLSENFKRSFLDDDDDDDDDDVMSRSIMISDVSEDVQEAACVLMMLSYTSSKYCSGIKKAMETTPNSSEVRSSISCYKDEKEKEKLDGGKRNGVILDDKGLIVDMKIKKEIEVKVNNPQDETNKRSLGFDLNQPYHEEDHPYNTY